MSPRMLVLLLLAAPVALSAQTTQELDIDFRPFAGTLSYVWNANQAGTRAWGIAAGGGIDELDRTLVPSTASYRFEPFYQLIHVGALHRWRSGTRWDVDLGLRLGLGDVRNCDASDCWPGAFIGLYVAPMWGGRTFKIGPRLLTAVSRYNDHRDAVVYVEVLNGRLALRW